MHDPLPSIQMLYLVKVELILLSYILLSSFVYFVYTISTCKVTNIVVKQIYWSEKIQYVPVKSRGVEV